MKTKPTLINEIWATQDTYPQLERIKTEILAGKTLGFIIDEDGTLRF